MSCFGFGIPAITLDEEFDAPDNAADHELCRALMAGKAGLHPDGWGNHDPLPLRWLLRYRPGWQWPEGQPAGYDGHRRRPVEEPKRPVGRPRKPWPPPPALPPVSPTSWWMRDAPGVIQLDCDECSASFRMTAHYDRGERDVKAITLRAMGRAEGWTHIVGRDRCPRCSCITVPEAEGNGTGAHQGDEQHA